MKLEHLYYFYEIARQGSYTAAAQKLYISQQALSRIIKSLEYELNTQLFERTPNGIKLTIYGEILFNFAQTNQNHYIDMKNTFYLMQQTELSFNTTLYDLVVLTNPIFISTIFPPLIRNLRRTHPATRITLYETNTPHICEFISENRSTDKKTIFGFGNLPFLNKEIPSNILPTDISESIIRKSIALGNFVAYVSKTSPLAKYKSLSIHTLLKYPVIMYAPDSNPDPTTDFFLRNYGEPNIAFLANNIGVMAQYISMNLGIGYLIVIDQAQVVYDDKFNNMVRIQIEEDSQTICSLFYHKELESNNPLVQTFLDTLPFTSQI